MTRVEKDARGFLEDNMKPTHQAVRSSSICEDLLGSDGDKMAYSVDHCSEIEINQKGRRDGSRYALFYFSLTLSHYLHRPPFLWGTLFQDSSTLL